MRSIHKPLVLCLLTANQSWGTSTMVFSKTNQVLPNLKLIFFKVILKDLNNFAIPWFFYRQMWVKLFMGDYNLNNIVIYFFKNCTYSYWGKKHLQFFKNWTYILHNKNIFVQDLMKTLLDSQIELNPIYEDCRFFVLFITCYFKLFFEPFKLHNYKL